jgi:hypothetical protein
MSERRSRAAVAAFFVVVAILFLIANKAAYKGYFQDDDLDTISWAYGSGINGFIDGWATPFFSDVNFRPSGHFYYWAMIRLAGLHFPPWVGVIHVLHFLNVVLLWLVMRKLGLGRLAAASGALFFAFEAAVLHVYWRPMYVFDLVCGLFCLLSLLAYMHKRTLVAVLCFWFAYKAKEVAIMLPVVLACYEIWFGERRWRRLVPFFAISLSFGLQALVHNHETGNPYRLRLALATLWDTLSFYSSRILLIPYGFLLILLVPLAARDRRAWFGVAALGLFMIPMLLLPGRLFAAYLYVPLIGLAIAVAGIAAHRSAGVLAAFFVLWLSANYLELRIERRWELAIGRDNRAYVSEIARIAPRLSKARLVVFDGKPTDLKPWGASGAIHYLTRRHELDVRDTGDPDIKNVLQRDSLALLTWDEDSRTIEVDFRTPDAPMPSYVSMSHTSRFFEFGAGWWDRTGAFRWIGPKADAKLWRPANAREFELKVNVGPLQIERQHRFKVEVFCDGRLLGSHEFTEQGWQTVRWDVVKAPAGPVRIDFQVTPEFHPGTIDTRTLGVPIVAFGFLPREE